MYRDPGKAELRGRAVMNELKVNWTRIILW